jgi:hypothetical protein
MGVPVFLLLSVLVSVAGLVFVSVDRLAQQLRHRVPGLSLSGAASALYN